jgi:hypothetical protein
MTEEYTEFIVGLDYLLSIISGKLKIRSIQLVFEIYGRN